MNQKLYISIFKRKKRYVWSGDFLWEHFDSKMGAVSEAIQKPGTFKMAATIHKVPYTISNPGVGPFIVVSV